MSDVTISPNMKLPVPNLTDPGPDYANNVNSSLDIIDAHDHDGVNGGVLIDLSIQEVLSDLSLDGHNLTNVRSVELNNNPSQLVGSQDVNSVYVLNNNLGFNNSNGVFVPITSGTTLAITSLSLTNFSSRNISSNAVILPTDTYNLINVDSTSGAVSVTLPIAALISPNAINRLYIVRDVGEDAGLHNITIFVAGGSGNVFADSGATSFVLNTNGGYVGIYTDGVSNWYTWTQNTYDTQTVSINSGSLELSAGSDLDINASSLNVNSGSAINLVSATESIDHSSTLTVNGTSNFNSGSTTVFATGSSLEIDGLLQGITTSGNLDINGTGHIQSAVAGGIRPIVANGINDGGIIAGIQPTVTGGIRSSVAGGIAGNISGGIQSLTNGGIQNAGGSSDWVSFSSTRQVQKIVPLQTCGGPTVMLVGNGLGTSGDDTFYSTNTGITTTVSQRFVIQPPHNGALLTEVSAFFLVSSSPGSFPTGASLPSIAVYRVFMQGGQGPPIANRQFLSTSHIQPLPDPGSTSAWYAGGNLQELNYITNQNNVIDNTQYQYYVSIFDPSSNGTGIANYWFCLQLAYTSISNMQFP